MLRIASLTSSCFAVVCLCLAAYHYSTLGELPGETLRIDIPDQKLGAVVCSVPFAVAFKVENTSPQTIQVLGLALG